MGNSSYALITGASSGIGACFARALASRGHNLILVARSREKLEALALELQGKHNIQALPCKQDLSQPGAAAALAAKLREQGRPVQLLLNNAGFGAHGRFWELPLERQAEMLRLNMAALAELTHALLGPMLERRSGAIINVSSTAGFQPVPNSAAYAASKAFVLSFSLALAEEVRAYGIRVVTLCPGGTDTNFFAAGQYGKVKFPGGLLAPESVVAAALEGLDRGGGLVVPGWMNKLSVASQRLAPRSWVTRIAGRMFRR